MCLYIYIYIWMYVHTYIEIYVRVWVLARARACADCCVYAEAVMYIDSSAPSNVCLPFVKRYCFVLVR